MIINDDSQEKHYYAIAHAHSHLKYKNRAVLPYFTNKNNLTFDLLFSWH